MNPRLGDGLVAVNKRQVAALYAMRDTAPLLQVGQVGNDVIVVDEATNRWWRISEAGETVKMTVMPV